MEEPKRIRHANWSEQEKKVLRMLVLERVDVIEKKGGTTSTNAAKKLAWEEVLLRFNAVNAYKRSTTQLVNQWRNMKNNSKKAEFAYRKTRTIPNEFIVDSNAYDSDSIYARQLKDSSTTHDSNESQAPAVLPATSQTKKTRPLVTPRANKNQNKNKNNSDCCRDSHEHQLFLLTKTAREEAMIREKEAHEFKMKNERESHERRMELMCLEEDYWKAKIMKLR